MPAEHDGVRPFAFEIVFSEESHGLSLAAFTNGALEVGNGRVVDAKRSTPGENRRGTVRMRPASGEATTVTLNETTDCDAAGAICTTGGRALSNSATATVARPSVNAAATGAPTITGEAQAGETLTASTDGIESADGLSG